MHRTGRRAIVVILLAALVVIGGGSLAFAGSERAASPTNGRVSRTTRRADESVLAVAPTPRTVVADTRDSRLAKKALRLLMGAALVALTDVAVRRRRPPRDVKLQLADPPWSLPELTRGPPAAGFVAA